jgi:hypothetical protein
MNKEKMGKIAARVKVGGGTCGSREKKMPIPIFIVTYKHRESIKKTHMPSMERRALENKVSENRMGNNFQDSLF